MLRETTTALAVALAAALASAPVRADDAPAPRAAAPVGPVVVSARLELIRGPGAERCPAERKLHDEVARRLGYDPFASGAEGRFVGRVRTTLARSPRGLTATSELVDPAGASRWIRTYTVRSTSARDCELAVVGAAVEIAAELTLFDEPDPPAARGAAAPAPAACPQHAAPAPCPESRFSVWPAEWPLPPLRAPEPDPPKPPERWPVAIRFGFAVEPEIVAAGWGSFGLSANVGVRYRAFSITGEAHGDPSLGSVPFESGSVSFARVSGSLLVCGHVGWFAGCVVGDAGRLLFPDRIAPLPPSTLYGALGARGSLEVPVLPPFLFMRMGLDVLAPIHPASYAKMGRSIFAVAGPGAGLVLGLLLELPPRF